MARARVFLQQLRVFARGVFDRGGREIFYPRRASGGRAARRAVGFVDGAGIVFVHQPRAALPRVAVPRIELPNGTGAVGQRSVQEWTALC